MIRSWRRAWADWRTWAWTAGFLAAFIMAALLWRGFGVTEDLRTAASRRIDILSSQIADQSTQIAEMRVSLDDASDRIATLLAQVDALQRQVEQLGGDPVVPRGGGSSEPDPSPEPSPSPQPSPEPSPQPEPSPSPLLCTQLVCVYPP